MTATASIQKYDSVVAAKYLMALAYDKGIVLNVTKVQKLLFIAYGSSLAKYDCAFIDEAPKAWPYGPVFPRTRKKIDYGIVYELDDPSLSDIKEDKIVRDIFENVISEYSKFSAAQLSAWSHTEGGPWHKTTEQSDFDWNEPIPDDYIKAYFSTLNV